jgi:retron-type reverse transcriptase
VVETAVLLVLEPIFGADLAPEQYAYRPDRGAHDAIRAVHSLLNTGHTQVIDADLSGYLDRTSYCPLVYEVTSNRPGCSSKTLILKPFLRP